MVVAHELVLERRRRLHRDGEEGRLQLAERMSAWEDVDHEPTLGAGESTVPQRGDQAGLHDGGLARARGSDDREEPLSLDPARRAVPRSRRATDSRPKKSPASASRKARSPLYGLRISDELRSSGTSLTGRSERRCELQDVCEPVVCVLGRGPSDHPVHLIRELGPRILQGGDGFSQMSVEER